MLAAEHPERVLSLTSIMSTSGNRRVPTDAGGTQGAAGAAGRSEGPDSVIEHLVEAFGVIGSPAYPVPREELRQRVGRSVRRAYDPAGTARAAARHHRRRRPA